MKEYQIGAESFGAGAAVDGIGTTTVVGAGVTVGAPEPESTIVKVKALAVTADKEQAI